MCYFSVMHSQWNLLRSMHGAHSSRAVGLFWKCDICYPFQSVSTTTSNTWKSAEKNQNNWRLLHKRRKQIHAYQFDFIFMPMSPMNGPLVAFDICISDDVSEKRISTFVTLCHLTHLPECTKSVCALSASAHISGSLVILMETHIV